MATLNQNIDKTIHDFDSIRDAIRQQGVEVPEGTPTSQYAEKIQQIETGITPAGTVEITENGTHDITEYAEANVQVPQGVPTSDMIKLLDGSITSLNIPDGTTTLREQALFFCHSLTDVVMPDSLTYIGDSAFFGCENLQNVKFSNKLRHISRTAFASCSSLAVIDIPDSVTHISSHAFDDTAWLQNQPSGMVYAGKVAYTYTSTPPSDLQFRSDTRGISDALCYSWDALNSVDIPASIVSIGNNAFYQCSNLTAVKIHDIAAWCQIDFSNAHSNPLSWGYNLYLNDLPITDITISGEFKYLTAYAFCNCATLEHVTIADNVYIIGTESFRGSHLETITFGSNVERIMRSAFAECTALQSIVFSTNLRYIEIGAFDNCYVLTDVYYTGTEEQWQRIQIDTNNDYLLNATIHYNYTP